jgi:hypothetical protein
MIEHVMNQKALHTLASLKGQTFEIATGNHLAPNLLTNNFVVVTGGSKLVVSGSVSLVNFDRDIEEISHLAVNAISRDLVEEFI